jgi:hypothetical protein
MRSFPRAPFVTALVALVLASAGDTEPVPSAFVDMIQHADPRLVHIGGFQTAPIGEGYELLMAFAAPEPENANRDDRTFASLFCVGIGDGTVPVLFLGILPRVGPLTAVYNYQLDTLTPEDITFLVSEADYGLWRNKIKIFFNLERKVLLGHRELSWTPVPHVACVDGVAWCAGDRFIGRIPLTGHLEPELITRINSRPVFEVTRVETGENEVRFVSRRRAIVASGDSWRVDDIEPDTRDVIRVEIKNPEHETRHEHEIDISNSIRSEAIWGRYAVVAPGGVVIVNPAGKPIAHELQNFDYGLLRQKRHDPQIVRNPHVEFTLQNFIGGWQLVGDEIIFGTDFYDGEGESGIGAIGSFDFATETYHYEFVDELAPWSTSAILVDGDTIWIGMRRRPEGADYSGGILEYNRATKIAKVHDVAHITLTLAKCDDALVAGTEDGIYLIRREGMTRIVVTEALDGSGVLKEVAPISRDVFFHAPTYFVSRTTAQ